ncbi:MAG: hypothetical protein CO108_14045, partial [Deltaproteobacteria bacterium CG_4_9_14_3_um_filter_63_12]
TTLSVPLGLRLNFLSALGSEALVWLEVDSDHELGGSLLVPKPGALLTRAVAAPGFGLIDWERKDAQGRIWRWQLVGYDLFEGPDESCKDEDSPTWECGDLSGLEPVYCDWTASKKVTGQEPTTLTFADRVSTLTATNPKEGGSQVSLAGVYEESVTHTVPLERVKFLEKPDGGKAVLLHYSDADFVEVRLLTLGVSPKWQHWRFPQPKNGSVESLLRAGPEGCFVQVASREGKKSQVMNLKLGADEASPASVSGSLRSVD